MKKILVIAHNFWPENFPINNFIFNLAKNDVEISILTGKPNYPIGKIYKGYKNLSIDKQRYLKLKNVFIYRVPIITRGNSSFLRRILNYLSFIVSAILIGFFELRTKKIDHIMVYAPSPVLHSLVGIFFKKIKKAKLSIWLQDLLPQTLDLILKSNNRYIYYILDKVINYIYKSCDLIFVQSSEYKKILKKVVDQKKIFYLPNSRNFLNKKYKKKLSKNFDKKKFNICYFGNIGIVQEFRTILKVAEQLKKNKKINFHFFGEGFKKKDILKFIEQKKLNNFYLHSGVEEKYLDNIIKYSSILYLSLKKNKFLNYTSPSKLQLYLASGKPIIGEIAGESKKIINLSKSGYCINHGDSVNLKKKINFFFKIRNNKTKINYYCLNAKNYYKNNFSIDKTTSSFIKIIK